jgi:hypothetical protein
MARQVLALLEAVLGLQAELAALLEVELLGQEEIKARGLVALVALETMLLAVPGGMLALTTATLSAVAVAVAVGFAVGVEVGVVEIPSDLRQQCQAHPAQAELERKAPQELQARHLTAQQTSQPTQAGKCLS